MLEVTGIHLPVGRVPADRPSELALVRETTHRRLHVASDAIRSFELRKRSVDARRRSDVSLTYTVRITLAGGSNAERALIAKLARRRNDKGVRMVSEERAHFPLRMTSPLEDRPVVVGAGCAGLFCALSLARAGLAPLLVERGDDVTRRTSVVATLDERGVLDPESNIQFGLGGAGTFSDGKLATGTKSPYHRLVLECLVDAGADPQILYDSHPHVGSDVLPGVVGRIRHEIEAAGGEVRCRCRMTGLELVGTAGARRVVAVTLESRDPESGLVREERIPTTNVVLATGHSARDVFSLLAHLGVALERKTFAMGVRIEHLQADVDRTQYGAAAGNPALGSAPYKLAEHLDEPVDGERRSAFTFCMCPGGYVVCASSEAGGVVTNGMSLSGRDGTNANAGLLANVFPGDLPGDDPLAGVELQRACERRAFEMGGGDYVAPAQLVGDFLQGVPSSGPGHVSPTYPRGVTWGEVDGCLPPVVRDTLRAALPRMARRLSFFGDPAGVLTGVESRSSSPIRVTRGTDLRAVGVDGLWPVGEGAGYAGGIMSAATDGLRAAAALVDRIRR